MNTREETYHMTAKEMARLKVAERLLEGGMEIDQAADILMLSTRQVIKDEIYFNLKISFSKIGSNWWYKIIKFRRLYIF